MTALFRPNVPISDLVSDDLEEFPIRLGARPACRARVTTAVATYLQRAKPNSDWTLVATEYPFGNAVADLVWCNGPNLVIDEIKVSRGTFNESAIANQVKRLQAWKIPDFGPSFLGVRLVPLDRLGATKFFGPDGQLAPLPRGMELA